MKYFIVTKKHIRLLKSAAIIIPAVAIFSIFAHKSANQTVEVFSPQDIIMLPNSENKHSLSGILENILGFSPENPTTILSEYSAAFDNISTPAPTNMPTIHPSSPPTQTPSPIPITEKTISDPVEVKNETQYNINLSEMTAEPLPISDAPTVLIIHTHTTESYTPENTAETYIQSNGRSTDNSKNVVAIGNIIYEYLTNSGINTIHDTTVHDYPVYNGAYTRALSTISSKLNENPQINVILDIHRDAITAKDGSSVKTVTEINGKKTAQIMLVVGTNDGGLKHPNWQGNLVFASKIQNYACKNFSSLMRPLNLRSERFNQHMSPCSIIVEVGTNANTLSEAKEGALCIAKSIAAVLKS